MKLIWLPGALTDLENIYDFYTSRNGSTAKRVIKDILDYINTLSVFPELGKVESIVNYKSYRSLILPKRNIKIIYYLEDSLIYIAFIWDCRQNPETLQKRMSVK
ncbi:MAG: type II toxin-antitoxin system RelE/ParE family toxin [Tannerellaceae bacterium]|nr:type II toxin-antitoxin system RelE/ParE family toxin [Tannerellaceae bacterium]